MAIGAHTKQGPRKRVRAAAIAAAVIAVVGGVVAVSGAVYAANHLTHTWSLASTTRASNTPPAAVPLQLMSFSPNSDATDVAPNTPITLHFSAPLTAWLHQPTVTPSTAGSWITSGSTMSFTPTDGWVPYTTVSVTVPAGLAGAAGTNTSPLAAPKSLSFTIAPGSTLRVQQLLAELGYLPLAFTPAAASADAAVSALPVAGNFSWRYANTPLSLRSQWVQGQDNVIDRGAIMAFESTNGLTTDGLAGPQVWLDLLTAAAHHQLSSQPYNYLMVSESEPETLQVWSDGSIIASTLANTGIAAAPTALGTYPVYARYAVTTMSGLNPNGSHYEDPGVRWVAYFNGGDAVHEFPRPGYGYPQSLGCVELPSSTAEGIWGMDPIGTLVTVA
jgi:peptidoglycan hydrolase-like protein with peptidoglycan-binding domain